MADTTTITVPTALLAAAREATRGATARPWRVAEPDPTVGSYLRLGCPESAIVETGDGNEDVAAVFPTDAPFIVAAIALCDAAIGAEGAGESGEGDEAMVGRLMQLADDTEHYLGGGNVYVSTRDLRALLARLSALRAEASDWQATAAAEAQEVERRGVENTQLRLSLARVVEAGRGMREAALGIRGELEWLSGDCDDVQFKRVEAVVVAFGASLAQWDALAEVAEVGGERGGENG